MVLHYFCLIFLLFFDVNCFASFPADTLIKTENDFISIEHIQIDELVTCVRASGAYTLNKVEYKRTEKVHRSITIVLDTDTIITTLDQQLYFPKEKTFKEARHVKIGDQLFAYSRGYIPVLDIVINEQESEFFDISVKDWHNFFVSRSGVLVHNFAPVFGLGRSFGGSALEFIGTSLKTLACGTALSINAQR